jgi:hypothetical protein
VQVLGAAEDETTLRGQWKNRFLQNVTFDGTSITPDAIALLNRTPLLDVTALATLVDDIRRKGQLCEVSWLHLKRQGILTKFVQTWSEPVGIDLGWEVTFQWISQADEPSPAVLSSGLDLGDVQGSWQIAADALDAARANPPFQQAATFQQTVDSTITSLKDESAEVVGAVANSVNGASTTSDTVRRLASVMSTINGQSQFLRDEVSVGTSESERFALPVSQAAGGTPSFTSRLRANVYSRGLYDAARAEQSQANLQRDDYASKLDPLLIGAFVARDGQNLREVAVVFYGTQEEWGTLLTFNQLTSSRLSAGQVVFVPKLTSVQV